jgi:uncharacterized membrane protein
MSASSARTGQRLAFLDWTRGLAALIMLQGHVFHSFTRTDLRNSDTYVLSQFVGGLTPAVFLFLTGVTLAFLMDSSMKKGLAPAGRMWHAMRRSGFLLSMAFLFRLQMWTFSLGKSPWTDLFRVDILNCMGLAVIVLSPLAMFDTRDRVRFGLFSGLAIACASPLVAMADFGHLHPFARAWFVPDGNFFAIFPWGAFVAFGLCAGSVLRLTDDKEMHRVMQWATLAGLAMIFGAQYFSNLPFSIYPKVDFWVNSPALILIKTGIILVLASFAFLWTRHVNPSGWSFVRQIGTTSLLVYWVHTELVYGSWFWPWKENLGLAPTAIMAVGIILLMILLSVARTGYKGNPGLAAWFRRQWVSRRLDAAPQPAGD